MSRGTENHGECLTDESLTDYLEGGLDLAIKTASEFHLIKCEICRSRLAFFMRMLEEEVRPDEAVTLKAIENEWRANGRTVRGLPARRAGEFARWKIASGGVAAALLLALGTRAVIDHNSQPRSANEVIQLLLVEHRPFEARVSGQPYSPFIETRSAAGDSSYPLLAGQMARLSATSYEMGQFYLLQKDYPRSIGYLEMAEQETGAGAGVHNDLGVAYLEAGGSTNLQRAMTEFRHAILADPSFAPAVFNLGILYDRLGRSEQAETQWKHYLQIERDSKWLEEGRLKLEGIPH